MSNLYIVATPIGNLEDITLRALRTLREVNFIICEDTRVTAKLLTHYEIKKPLVSYHHHSKLDKINYIVERLEKGENAALVSDAGTPGINDPGGVLVKYVDQHELENESTLMQKIKVVPIPGPCAAITLASISGISMDKFLFMGFPPHKKGRQTFFKSVLESDAPVIFYESCHRILKALSEINSLSVNKNSVQIVLGRELTKIFEAIYRGRIDEVIGQLKDDKNNLKGEFTVIIYKTIKQENKKANENIIKLGNTA